jgi:hypothetical protein
MKVVSPASGVFITTFWTALIPWAISLSGLTYAYAESSPTSHRFPDCNSHYVPPADQYDGPLFRLSQQYPDKLPELDAPVKELLAIPFDKSPEESMKYLLAVRDYCFDGNLDVNWRGQENKKRKWYHVPWQHFGEKGREGINGLTREATSKPRQLAAVQTQPYQTHAVAMYNLRGGYTIGKVWESQFSPDASEAVFPIGTVVAKLLFTQARDPEVPYLVNPISWKAYIQDAVSAKPPLTESTARSVQDVRLLQMDIMVRDDRAKATGGWVFGTYCYNGTLNDPDKWQRLVPVGLQWGNDPGKVDVAENPVDPEATKTQLNHNLKETFISNSKDLPAQHLGWGGRLNGPADYYRSSCMSCHSTAQYPSVVSQHPDFDAPVKYKLGDSQWNAWFRNLGCGQAFSPISSSDKQRAISTDFSLQLAIGITQFYSWKAQTMGGYFTPELPDAPRPDIRAKIIVPASEPPQSP